MLWYNLSGSVNVVSTSREDWKPSVHQSRKIVEEEEEEEDERRVFVRIKERWDDDDGGGGASGVLDLPQPSQADWIRQYLERQEEVYIKERTFRFLFFFLISFFRFHFET